MASFNIYLHGSHFRAFPYMQFSIIFIESWAKSTYAFSTQWTSPVIRIDCIYREERPRMLVRFRATIALFCLKDVPIRSSNDFGSLVSVCRAQHGVHTGTWDEVVMMFPIWPSRDFDATLCGRPKWDCLAPDVDGSRVIVPYHDPTRVACTMIQI